MSKNSKNARRIVEAKQVSAQRKARSKAGKKYEEAPKSVAKHGKVKTLPYPRKPKAGATSTATKDKDAATPE